MFSKRPKSVVCYICGREYGTRSIQIHLKTCKKKWEIEQEDKPKKERKKCPEAPPGFDNLVRIQQGLKPIEDPNAPKAIADIPISGMS